MRPVLTILAAIALAGLAVYSFMHQQWLGGAAFLAGSLVLVLPALFGEGLGDLGDADLMIRFVKSPFGTIVDEAIDRVGQGGIELPQPAPTKPGDIEYPRSEQFDADAAIQRYLASKQSTATETVTQAATISDPPHIRTFGRKQV